MEVVPGSMSLCNMMVDFRETVGRALAEYDYDAADGRRL